MKSLTPALIYFSFMLGFATMAASFKPVSQRTLAIQPFAGIPREHVAEVKKALETYYRCKIQVLPEVPLPKETFTRVKTPRYRADKLLDFLRQKLPAGCDQKRSTIVATGGREFR